jgi:Pyruvate/2-oxoacid:ferredoxin oxidoreductase delta subunit
MVKRKIIQINEELCDGCGQCIPSCHEGALMIIDGKAKLVKESFCDGLGACLGECPRGALSIVEMTVEEFDEQNVKNHIAIASKNQVHTNVTGTETTQSCKSNTVYRPSGCPSAKTMVSNPAHTTTAITNSKLKQWPVQLTLVPPFAPFFTNADLYLIADCVPFAYPDFHSDFLDGHAIAVACPKLDNTQLYVQKIANIIKASSLKSIKAVVMEVPCCSGLVHITRAAIQESGMSMPFEVMIIGIQGGVLQKITI